MQTRPIIKLQLTPLDRLLEIIGKCCIALLWILTLFAFFNMPDIVPTHFNASGQADNYGSKGTIFILPVIATNLFIVLTLLNNYPHILNYPTKITEANAVSQYTIATRMSRFLKLAVVIIFTAIALGTLLTSLHITPGLGHWFLPVFEVLIFLPTIYAITAFFNKKKQEKKGSI